MNKCKYNNKDKCQAFKVTIQSEEDIENLLERIEKLNQILHSYKVQYQAAIRATSLALCKRCIKHALEDERMIRQKDANNEFGSSTKKTKS